MYRYDFIKYKDNNYLRGIILILLLRESIFVGWGSPFPIVLVPRYKFSLCHTPIKPDLLGFPGIGVFACWLRDHVIIRFASVTLLLADRSVKVLRGIVEDVLVQVDKFIYPVNFIVLDTQPVEACNLIPVILGRLFLATSNALINYRKGVMKLSFENMTLEINFFNICKQSGDDNDLQEVDFI